MDSRELVQLAKALTGYDNVRVLTVTITVDGDEIKDYVLHSNDDLFRPIHVNGVYGVAFDDCKEAVEFIESESV